MKKILIVEDDNVVAGIYSTKLRAEGHSVEVAPDGEAGRDKALTFRPDLVLTDLSLPKLSGVEVIRFLRSRPECEGLPIIVFSNMYLSAAVQEAWKAGATKCLSKVDCTPRQLMEVIREVLEVSTPAAPRAPATAEAVPLAPPPLSAPAASRADDSEEAFLAELRRDFRDRSPRTVSHLRAVFLAFAKAETEAQRLRLLDDLAHQVRQLFATAGMVGFTQVAGLAAALEALVCEMRDRPKSITASTQRTLAQTIDFFTLLTEQGSSTEDRDLAGISTLVVDDEPISRRAVTHALNRANLRSVSVEDPKVALGLLDENRFDLVILDVQMPGMSGFELCAKLRAMPSHAGTPVVFVTSQADFNSRAKSIMSGGNDLIAKPFVFMELAVKALTHVLRSRFVRTTPGVRTALVATPMQQASPSA